MGRPKGKGGQEPKGNMVMAGKERGQMEAPDENLPTIVRGGGGRAGHTQDAVVGRQGPHYHYDEAGREWIVLSFGHRILAPAYPEATPEVEAAAPKKWAKSNGDPAMQFDVDMGNVIMRLFEVSTWTGVSRSLGLHHTYLRNMYQTFEQGKIPAENRPYWAWLFAGINKAMARRQLLMEGTVQRAAENGDYRAADRILGVIAPEEWAPPKQVQIEHSRVETPSETIAVLLDKMLAEGASIEDIERLMAGPPEAIEVKSGPPEIG